jgi:hypothetical protein
MRDPGVPRDAGVARLLFIFERNPAARRRTAATKPALYSMGVFSALEASVRRVASELIAAGSPAS